MSAPGVRWWREPLVHFLALGAALFALQSVRAPREDPRRLEVSRATVSALRERHRADTGRAPTAAELRRLVRRHAQDEALYREALSRGMDRDDPFVRDRLVRRLEAELDDPSALGEPSDAQLRAWLAAHRERYRQGPVVSLRHVFTTADALPEGSPGEPFPFGSELLERAHEELLGSFGEDFARTVETAPVGQWVGPVRSRHGLHRVQVTARQEPRDATLAEVRERVRVDLLAEAQSRRLEAAREALLRRWHLRVEGVR
ncbi:MAG: peptidyl-prolyl cis-trans isomerase [Deltaproteobacteria bacterium]|nr:peptidyl-prolyl cis-trans isomerase [Deltaproteobacteria bacterium]